MSVWKAEQLPEFVNCILIDRVNNNKQSHLPHTHHNELELFYVYTGEGQYMVDNRLYPIRGGDIVVCNAGVLHGEEPALVREIPFVLTLAISTLLLTQALLRSRARNEAIIEEQAPSVLAHRVRHYLDEHHSEPLTLRIVADRLRVSEYYLAHVFKQEFGVPPMQYVMKRRIGEAQELLMNTSLPIAEVADRLGYSSVCHFNAMFKKNVGMPPGKFRRSFQSEEDGPEKDKE